MCSDPDTGLGTLRSREGSQCLWVGLNLIRFREGLQCSWVHLNLICRLCDKHIRFEGLLGAMAHRNRLTERHSCEALGHALLTALSIPRVSSMRKKTAAQAEDSGSVAIASG